jgi:transposase
MATIKSYEKAISGEKYNRYFSDGFKKKVVDELDRKIVTVTEVSREYGVSATSVYKWLYRYSKLRKKGMRQIVETESDTRKLKELKEEIKELHRIIGEKQILLDFQRKLIERAEKEYKVDIKKKLSEKLYSGTGTTEKRTDIK